eukprot:gb/GECG01016702.1/.p1 GENE.gb/GECG01016702.1/~~gb/GECG01016702.1/.p1  ORF type:complete len:286 (+),score=38.28 gb/GECG01016702.1/:1-858(+)
MQEKLAFGVAIATALCMLLLHEAHAESGVDDSGNYDATQGFTPAVTEALAGPWRGYYVRHDTGYRAPAYFNFSSLVGGSDKSVLRSSVLIKEEDGKLRRTHEWFVRATGNWSVSISERRISSLEYVAQAKDEHLLSVGDITQSTDWLHLTLEDIGGSVMTSSGIANSKTEHNEVMLFSMFMYIPNEGDRNARMERRRLLLTTISSQGQALSTYSLFRRAKKSESFLSTYRWPLLIVVWLAFMVAKVYMRQSLTPESASAKRKAPIRKREPGSAAREKQDDSKKDK